MLLGEFLSGLRVGLLLQERLAFVADRQGVDLRIPQGSGVRLLLLREPGIQLVLSRLQPLLPSRFLLAIPGRLGSCHEEGLIAPGGGEGALQPVVIAGRDGVVLVVVAARAAERQAEEGRGRGDRHVVQLVEPEPQLLLLHGHRQHLGRRGRQEARGRQCARVVGFVFVARDLPADECPVRHVVVHGPDHEVAVVIRGRPVGVGLQPIAVRIAGDIEPVPAPSLAVVPAGEETVDQLLVGVGCRVRDERLHLLGRRGQAEQVEIDPADQGAPVCPGIRANASRLEGGENEPVDRSATPARIADFRGIDAGQAADRTSAADPRR